jgi:hypothetical protein
VGGEVWPWAHATGQPTSRSSLLDHPHAIFFPESLEEGQTKEKMTEICGWKKVLTAPTLLSRWEKRGRGGTEDETVKPLDGI